MLSDTDLLSGRNQGQRAWNIEIHLQDTGAAAKTEIPISITPFSSLSPFLERYQA